MKIFSTQYRGFTLLPLFLLLCFSGNPAFTSEFYSKGLFVVYTFFFFLYLRLVLDVRLPDKLTMKFIVIISFILILVIFQKARLGYVSYPGVIALLIKMILAVFTVLYYQHKRINFFDAFVKLMAFL